MKARAPGMARVGVWVEAARPKTLPAGLVPVLVGTAASPTVAGAGASAAGLAAAVSWPRFVLALIVALSLQVAVNFANDYFDASTGVDDADRLGPRRLVAAGVVTPARMRAATLVALTVAGAAGLVLAALAGWELLLVGLAAGVAALTYSGGPRPYGSRGLGEVAVFVFFGVVATVGSAYVQAERLSRLAVLASVPVGLLAVSLLVVNNLRDIPTDARAGKHTLAVRLGEGGTRRLYAGLVGLALALVVPLAAVAGSPWVLATLLAGLPLAGAVRLVWTAPRHDRDARGRQADRNRRLITALEATGRGQLAYGVVLALTLLLVRLPGGGPGP